MRFEWDEDKAAINWRKHRVRFAAASEVFRDPFARFEQDQYVNGEERWQGLGVVGGQLYFVAFTTEEEGEEEV